MSYPICAKCKKRPASVFITRLEKGESINEGLCLICAKELGIKPVDNMLKQMGLSEDAIASMSQELEDAMADMSENMPEAIDGGDDGGAPAIDFQKFFSGLGMPPPPSKGEKRGEGKADGKGAAKKAEDGKKFLNQFCTNLNKKASSGKIDRLVGRERELQRVIQILCRKGRDSADPAFWR